MRTPIQQNRLAVVRIDEARAGALPFCPRETRDESVRTQGLSGLDEIGEVGRAQSFVILKTDEMRKHVRPGDGVGRDEFFMGPREVERMREVLFGDDLCRKPDAGEHGADQRTFVRLPGIGKTTTSIEATGKAAKARIIPAR